MIITTITGTVFDAQLDRAIATPECDKRWADADFGARRPVSFLLGHLCPSTVVVSG